jgi:Ca-activated chloride channel family protein
MGKDEGRGDEEGTPDAEAGRSADQTEEGEGDEASEQTARAGETERGEERGDATEARDRTPSDGQAGDETTSPQETAERGEQGEDQTETGSSEETPDATEDARSSERPETPAGDETAGDEPDPERDRDAQRAPADDGDRTDAGRPDQESPEGDDADPKSKGGVASRGERPAPAEVTPPEGAGDHDRTQSIDRFDQLAEGETDRPGDAFEQDAAQSRAALDGTPALGAGMTAVLEQRLRQVEGDPSLLIRNQYRLEELRSMQESGGPILENRPW